MTELRGALDEAVLSELRVSVGDDPEFLAELIDDFLEDAPTQVAALREAVASGDATSARRAAHTLKGTSRTFGAGELASLCQDAETGRLGRSRRGALAPRRDRAGVEPRAGGAPRSTGRSRLMLAVARRTRP